MKSQKISYERMFSHVYVEESIADDPHTGKILDRLKNPKTIPIRHYKDVFNKPSQHPLSQRHSKKLIIASNRGKKVFPGAPFCHPCGHGRFYSVSQVLNCPFDCSYCYLKGKYPGANIVAFTNTGDYLDEVSDHIGSGGAMMALSYDSDEAALEPVLGILEDWYPFIEKNGGTTFEIRTKSCFIPSCAPMPNFVTAFSVLPQKVISTYESGTPTLAARLSTARELLKNGFRVRLCVDPVLPVEDAVAVYSGFAVQLAREIDLGSLEGLTLGGFRMTTACRRAVQKLYGDHFIHFYPMKAQDGAVRLPMEFERPVIEALIGILKKHLSRDLIFTL